MEMIEFLSFKKRFIYGINFGEKAGGSSAQAKIKLALHRTFPNEGAEDSGIK